MTKFPLTFLILLANQATFQRINATDFHLREGNKLSRANSEKGSLQIEENRTTTETTPATFTGNNLNAIGASAPTIPLDVQTVNFQAISTIFSLEKKKSTKNNYGTDEENIQLLTTFNDVIDSDSEVESRFSSKTMPLVWDDCLETSYKDNYMHVLKIDNNRQNDIEVRNQISPRTDNKVITSTGDNLNKRDTVSPIAFTFSKALQEQYNKLRNTKSGEKGLFRPHSILLKRITPSSPTAQSIYPITTLKIVPITRELFVEPTHSFNQSLEVLLTENNVESSYTEDWFETNDRSKIRFGELPQTETYLIPTLKLEEGFYPFSFMSEFFTFIYPFDLPIGYFKDLIIRKTDFPYSFIQIIKVESTFLAFIVIFVCIALIIPIYLTVLCVLSLLSVSRCRDDNMESGALFEDEDEQNCSGSVLVVTTLIIVLVCLTLISGMAITNEQAHNAAEEARNVISCACADVSSWLVSSARELHHSIVPPIDLVLHAYREDLKNAETLLGEPIQQAIASESGIDLVLDSLADIVSESDDLATKISLLHEISLKAEELAAVASGKIMDLAKQLDNMKKYCLAKDAPLCDTINTNSLDIRVKFNVVLQEHQLLGLRSLGVDNLTRAISTAKQEFHGIPSAITSQTTQVRNDILRDIEIRRQSIHSSSKILNDIVRYLTTELHSGARKMETGLLKVLDYEFIRWILMLSCIVAFAFVMALILTAMLCGCRKAKNHGKRTLQISAAWISFTSVVLWCMISTIFLIAGHAEVFICQALWDSPQYKTLSALLDRPSPLLDGNKGVFDELFQDLNNITIDVSIKNILRECEKDEPAYTVFQLDKILDVNKETSYFEWQELQNDLNRLADSINVAFLRNLSTNFIKLLSEILVATDVNLPKYRMSYNVPVVGKDLPSLVDQLENIAAQVSDLTTGGRLETLATRTQRLQVSTIKPLEQMRAELVFKLTELELQLMPFRRKLNISLSHIQTAQYYINNQGDIIAQKKVSSFVSRLVSHAAGWRTHALAGATGRAARCRPLHRVFSAARALLCSRYLSSLHGWWVCGSLLGVCWLALVPLCVRLWRNYGRRSRLEESLSLAHLNAGHHGTPTTAVCDGNWNIPEPPEPPSRRDSW